MAHAHRMRVVNQMTDLSESVYDHSGNRQAVCHVTSWWSAWSQQALLEILFGPPKNILVL